MGKRLDLTGRVFGHLTALCSDGAHPVTGNLYWRCRCACGKETRVLSSSLQAGKTQSCGCKLDRWRVSRRRHGRQAAYAPVTQEDWDDLPG